MKGASTVASIDLKGHDRETGHKGKENHWIGGIEGSPISIWIGRSVGD